MTSPTKAELRAHFKKLRREVSAEARRRASASVCSQLLAKPLGLVVAVYLAGPDELDLSAFIEAALRRGTRILAPRWTGETYRLAELRGLSPADLRPGPHGILEPKADAARVEAVSWIVPGLAFTRDGVRLGYGGGWYDRLLADVDASVSVLGVAYPFQVVDSLPSEPHDRRLTGVVVASPLCP